MSLCLIFVVDQTEGPFIVVEVRKTVVRVFNVQTDVRVGGPNVTAARTSRSDSD